MQATIVQSRSALKGLLRPGWRAVRRALIDAQEAAGDQRLGIRTRIQRIDWSRHDFKVERVPYDPVPYSALAAIDRLVPFGPDEVVYDLGCGMARAVCHYAAKPVRKVVGVEFDGVLAAKAETNVASLRGRRAPAQIVQGDAASVDLSDATLVFMFNPFGPKTMEAVLSNLTSAMAGTRIVYVNPVQEDVIHRFDGLREIARFKVRYDLGHAPVAVWVKA